MTATTPAQVVGDFWTTLESHDKQHALETLSAVPTLVVVGDRDRLTPPSDSLLMARSIAGSRLLELRDAGHCTMLEQPETVNAALVDLVETAAAAATARRQKKAAS
jgi:pimeloyl-ACP methyl ester carboxylesterase